MLWITAITAIITTATTVVLAIITGRYVQLTKQMLKSTNTPVVRLFLHADGNNITLCIENIGTGFARDIKFTGDLSFKPFKTLGENQATLEELEPFKSGIDYLGPGHKIETFLFYQSMILNLPEHSFGITATYKDLANMKNKETFTFEIGNWDNTDQFSSPHTDETVPELKKIAQILGDMRRDGLRSDRWDNSISSMQNALREDKDPLERIADAIERMSSEE